jgi:Cellulase (glycosyl hydrolase family 5)
MMPATLSSGLRRAVLATASALALLALAVPSAEAARARVSIQNGNVVSDSGSPLRGAPFFMSIFNTRHMRDNETTYRNYFRTVANDYKMNAVRVSPWVGNWEYDIKNNSNHKTEMLYMIDKAVQWAGEDNIYCIINLHTAYNTVLTRQKVKDFWDIVAPRHKDKTHVIFEVVNEPNIASAKSHMAGIYSDVRALAPNTHLILWSLNNPDSGGFTLQDIRNASSINYSNASFGFHVYEYTLGKNAKWERAKSYRSGGYPVICSEFYSLTNANDKPIDYRFLTDNIKFARSSTYNMAWVQWAPRFNYASIDQYGSNHLYNSDIGFFQRYKDEVVNKGITKWW